ncbi:MAG: TetR family transcriptional regulator C-terminal domain-containing protein [Cyanobacteriota bacterium]|nr:TetR family transcriptional regulator C-terminal domain-containing protein [Cyanobacteriota bacterium]
MNKLDTRALLLQAGTQIIREKGFHHTGIQEILQATGVPKGSFYHYFTSKEDFGLQMIEQEAAAHQRVLDAYLLDITYSPLTRLRRYFTDKREAFASLQCREGCLLGNLGQELGDQLESFRCKLAEVFAQWRQQFAQCLAQAQQQEEIPSNLNVSLLAEFCMSGWEGALLQMKVSKSLEPIDAFISILFDHVLIKPGSGKRDP